MRMLSAHRAVPCDSVQSVRGCRRHRWSSEGCPRASPCLCTAWKRRSSAAGPSASGTGSLRWWSNWQPLASTKTVSDGKKDEDVISGVSYRCAGCLTFFRVNFVLCCWETPVRRSCISIPFLCDTSSTSDRSGLCSCNGIELGLADA